MFRFSPEAFERLRGICAGISSSRNEEWWLADYRSYVNYIDKLNDPQAFRKHMRAIEHDLGLLGIDFAGKTVLDAGSGSGIFSMMLALAGAADVQAIEIWEPAVRFVNGYMNDVVKNELPVQVTQQDAAKLDFPDSHFDAVFCREAISHISDPYAFLSEAGRLLKPGGKLLIVDGNNASNCRVRRLTYGIWQRFENGPSGLFHSHNIVETIRDKRRRILRASFPELSEDVIDLLAQRTSGMNEELLLAAAQEYQDSGKMPDSEYKRGQCPIDPDTGMLIEALFYPYELAKKLSDYGFDAKVYAYFSHGRHPVLAAISRVLERVSPVSIYFAPTFEIVATRR